MRADRPDPENDPGRPRQMNWRPAARCRVVDRSLFFHPLNEPGAERKRRIMKAKNVCAHCPVVAACREHALTRREPFGIWGGLSEEDRAALLSRGRSQPRIDTLR